MAQRPPRKNRGCILVYIYAYFLGLGTGLIATISLAEKDPPLITWILLPLGMVISLITCTVHIVLTCRVAVRSHRDTYKRAVLDIAGLSLAAAVTWSGTFTFLSEKGLFFLCGVFSGSCYFMATIALSVNLYQTWKRYNAQLGMEVTRDDSRSPETNRQFLNEMEMLSASASGTFLFPVYLGSLQSSDLDGGSRHLYETPRSNPRSVSVISSGTISPQSPTRDNSSPQSPVLQGQQFHDLTVAQLALLAIPPTVTLPSYAEVTAAPSDSPPKYSELPDDIVEISTPPFLGFDYSSVLPEEPGEASIPDSSGVEHSNVPVPPYQGNIEESSVTNQHLEDSPPDYYESASQDL